MLAKSLNLVTTTVLFILVAFSGNGFAGTGSPLFADGFEAIEGFVSCPSTPSGPITGRCEVEVGDDHLLIRSSFVTPDTFYENAELLIDAAGTIQCAACDCSNTAGYDGATALNCPQVLVSPGLINSHEHLTFQGGPVDTGSERYDHRHDWRLGLDEHTQIPTPSTSGTLAGVWGEVRQLLGGATSMIGSGNRSGLVRNLDNVARQDGLEGPLVRYSTFPLGDSNGPLITSGCGYPGTPSPSPGEVYHAHIAEGVGLAARNEWLCASPALQGMDLALPGPSLVHAIAMTAADIPSLQTARATVVWSPRSDIMLYGMTAPVTMLAGQGVNLALGTNWAVTGSMNMLRELSCANQHTQTGLNSYFSAQDLLKMATSNAANAAGVGDKVGQIAPGYVADLTLFDAGVRSGYSAAVEADQEDVVLVLKAGVPLFGDGPVVDSLSAVPGTCELMGATVPGGCMADRRICLQETGFTYSALVDGSAGLVPLYACSGPPTDEPTCTPARSNEDNDGIVFTGLPTPEDSDGDGVPNGSDNCPLIFNPPRPVDNFLQADGDNDGIGDVCDDTP